MNYEARQYQVEVCYDPGELVVGVKELIVAKLTDASAGPRVLSQVDVRVEDLILKTRRGRVIDGTKMPKGTVFSADLLMPTIAIERPLKKSKLALVEIEVKPAPLGEIEGSGFFFEASGLFYAGLATEESDKKRLFMRQASLELVGLLRNLCDGDSPGMRIFGAPGVGKSCTVWAWACDERLSNDKKVLWVHVLAKGPPEDVVLMTGKKIFHIECTAADIMSSDADIIVVDGVTNAGSHDKYSCELLTWGICQEHRRWVQVASTELRLNEQDEEAQEITHFEMPPWTLQEYIAACRDDDFYNHVSCMFKGLSSGVADETIAALQGEDREELIKEKFFYAGCSARWMFNYTTAEVKDTIEEQFNRCTSFMALTAGGGGGAVNHFWVGYPSEDGKGFTDFFVSQYVARVENRYN